MGNVRHLALEIHRENIARLIFPNVPSLNRLNATVARRNPRGLIGARRTSVLPVGAHERKLGKRAGLNGMRVAIERELRSESAHRKTILPGRPVRDHVPAVAGRRPRAATLAQSHTTSVTSTRERTREEQSAHTHTHTQTAVDRLDRGHERTRRK